jgi:dTDP-glucose 4,6-dehydratase
MATVIVTGGAGFIGSALVRMIVREAQDIVVNVDKLTYAASMASLDDVRGSARHVFVRADINDSGCVRALFEQHRPRAVVHLAAESHVDRSIDAPADFIQTNLLGTFTLLQEARRFWSSLTGHARDAFRFVHVSTDEVFGSLGATGAFTEESRYAPTSPYSATKAGSDHLARAWHDTYGLPVVVTNSSNNYGPYQFPEKLIPLMIERGRRGETLPVYARGENVRDWLYVDDHARALWRALERGRPGETYLIGGRQERRNIDVVRAICALLDELVVDSTVPRHEALIEYVEDRPGHDPRYAINPSKAERELGWRAETNFEIGLRSTVQWYLANAAWSDELRHGASGEHHRGERQGRGVTI